MLYGDDPEQGVIDGRNFIYPPGRVAFSVPEGFTISNSAQTVSIAGNGGKAQFASARYDGDLGRYVDSVLAQIGGNTGRSSVQRTSINGIPAAYTFTRGQTGQTTVDVTVFAYAPSQDRAYHFVVVTPGNQGLGALEPLVSSFRTMTSADAAAARPRYVRVVTVRNGDTQAGLAARMAFPQYGLERFRVLNRLDAAQSLRPGDKLKIVTY